ncbi:dynein light chain Tctex-type 5-B-like isoform X2 [Dreissena polymorpha]|uniref:dynein light chain Tctex-type 5-B-like isoform X2 n=1 Tax=Dreissena polymorpha TaxID=45954 RepID=UPI002264D8F9|nr:dynein light chain Tctex-type 5-B-like isoform X2 [Dreissena polymorpha]
MATSTSGAALSANEKLTLQALKDHDKVHPKLSATPVPPTLKDGSKVSSTSRRSHASGDQSSSRSDRTGKPPRINFFKFVVATRAWHRIAKNSSIAKSSEKLQPVVRYENTYKTDPEKGQYFAPGKVEEMLKDTMEKKLKCVKYSPEKCRLITTELTAEIKSKVKALEFPRYKIVCNVVMTENKRQGLEIASRCVWNHSTDNFASYTYRNATLIAMANVYGVYFE